LLSGLKASGATLTVLIGRGEFVEIAQLAVPEAEPEIVGLLDREWNVESLHGLTVLRSPDAALVMTASRQPQGKHDDLILYSVGRMVVAPSFLHIVRQEPDGGRRPVCTKIAGGERV
jgi:hypothetical protein